MEYFRIKATYGTEKEGGDHEEGTAVANEVNAIVVQLPAIEMEKM